MGAAQRPQHFLYLRPLRQGHGLVRRDPAVSDCAAADLTDSAKERG